MQNEDRPGKWQVVSFPPSNDCDLASWVLKRYGVDHRETMHTLGFLQIKSKLVGGTGKFPTVYKDKSVFNSLDEVLAHFEPLADAERKLFPADEAQNAEVKKLWDDFHNNLGYAGAKWAYAYLLPIRSIMVGPFSYECPWYEKTAVRLLYGLLARVLRRGLKITPETPETALQVITETFDRVEAMLADGREFLVGDRLTIADIGFAAMAMPAVWPPQFGGASPDFDQLPTALRDHVIALRERPAGQFALKMYREYR